MPRVKRSVHARKKRRKVLEQAKGYWGLKSTNYKYAKEQVERSLSYAYRDRKVRKREFRQALDHAHQRRRTRERPLVQPVHLGLEGRRDRARPEGARRPRGRRPGEVRRARRAGESRARRPRNSPARREIFRRQAGVLRRPLAALRRALPPLRGRPAGRRRSRPTSTGTSRCACSARCTTSCSRGEASWDDVDAALDRRTPSSCARFTAEQEVQTNEVQRAWALLPGLPHASPTARPLDLLELGPSAGPEPRLGPLPLPLLDRLVGRRRARAGRRRPHAAAGRAARAARRRSCGGAAST